MKKQRNNKHMCPGLKAGDRVTRRGKRSEASQIHLGLRGGRCAEEGPGGWGVGGTTQDVAGTLMPAGG